jgi:hypothetical protein
VIKKKKNMLSDGISRLVVTFSSKLRGEKAENVGELVFGIWMVKEAFHTYQDQ